MSQMTKEQKILVAQLIAGRDALAATITQIDACLTVLGVGEEPGECPHPKDQIVNHQTTLDDAPDDFECQACGARQPLPFHPSED